MNLCDGDVIPKNAIIPVVLTLRKSRRVIFVEPTGCGVLSIIREYSPECQHLPNKTAIQHQVL